MVKRLVWSFIFLLVLIAAGMGYVSMNKADPRDTQVVEKGMIRRLARGSGRIEGGGEPIVLTFGRPGYLEKVNVAEGEEIDLDSSIVAELSSAELKLKVEEAKAVLKVAESRLELVKIPRSPESIKQAQEKLGQAANDVKSAEIKLKVLKEPPTPPPAPPSQIEEAERTIEKARQKLALEESGVKQIKSGPTGDEKAISEINIGAARDKLASAEKQLAEFKEPLFQGKQTKGQLELAVELARKDLQRYEAERDRLLRGPTPHELTAAEARVKLARTELVGAEAAKVVLEKPAAPPPAPEHVIAEAALALQQAQAKERELRSALEERKRGPEAPEVAVAEGAREQAEKSLALLKLHLEGLKLRAPFAGRVLKRHVEPGAMVNAFSPIITMLDFSRKRVRAEFDVARLADIKKGMPVTLSSRAFKETLDGSVEKIVRVGTRSLSSEDPSAPKGGEVVEVLVSVEEPKGEVKKRAYDVLLPGLRADVDITLEKKDGVVRVPKSFVSSEKDEEFVWLKRGAASASEYVKQHVKCGLRDEHYVEIAEGLAEGDMIAKPKPLNK